MRKIMYVNTVDGRFMLWEKPLPNTEAKIFAQIDPEGTDRATYEIEDAFLLEDEYCIVGAGLAVSNLGHSVNAERIVEMSGDERMNYTPRLAIENLAGHLCENEEHDEIFVAEAEMWHEQIKELSVNEILRQYGDRHPWIEQIILSE